MIADEQRTLFGGPVEPGLRFGVGWLPDVNPLLRARHYLGPMEAGTTKLVLVGRLDGEIVAGQIWRLPTSRRLPSDGTWLELSRWVLTPEGGKNLGSRMHGFAVRWIRANRPEVTTLVSYSDPSVGHTGALYRASNWLWRPTWHVLRPPPTRGGSWNGVDVQEPKERWAFPVRPDPRFDELLALSDESLVRRLGEHPERPK